MIFTIEPTLREQYKRNLALLDMARQALRVAEANVEADRAQYMGLSGERGVYEANFRRAVS